MEIGSKALNLILSFEGFDQPGLWPGSASGITIGRGYDLGYEKSFREDWHEHLSTDVIAKLSTAIGVKGQAARRLAPKFKGIRIPRQAGDEVFATKTLPKYISWTAQAWPGSEKLPPDAFGGLVSIIFNRGPLIDGSDRRREMRAIRGLVAQPEPSLTAIAAQVRSMARLWPNNPNSDGDLHDRRLAEAKLISEAV